ncbi:hypothetical protein D3C77_675360 [compost metagenome]
MQDHEAMRTGITKFFQGTQCAAPGLVVIGKLDQAVQSMHTSSNYGFDLVSQWGFTLLIWPPTPDFAKKDLVWF